MSWGIVVYVIRSAWEWFASRFIRRDHLLDMRGGSYRGGHLHPTEQVLYASFAALTSYVKIERKWLDWMVAETFHDPFLIELQESAREVLELYEWWQKRKFEDMLQGYRLEDDEMLHRLVDVRRNMWT